MLRSTVAVTTVLVFTLTFVLNIRLVKSNLIPDSSTWPVVQLVDKTTIDKSEQNTTINIPVTTTSKPVLDEHCSMYGSCDFPENKDPWYCQCDEACEEYNDCCLDYNRRKLTETSRYECQSLTTRPSDIKGYFAISVCPDGYKDGSVRDKCSHGNILERGPSVVNSNSQIYKNKYCAICNNVTDFVFFDIKFYNFRLGTDFEHYMKLKGFHKLNFTFFNADYKVILPDGLDWRFCLSRHIVTNDTYCQLFMNSVFLSTGRITDFYRNINCVLPDLRYKAICSGRFIDKIITTQTAIQGLSVMFSFTENSGDGDCEEWSEEVVKSGKCAHMETYQNYRIDIEYYLKFDGNKTDLLTGVWLLVFSMEITNLTQFKSVDIAVEDNSDVARITIFIQVVKRAFSHEIKRITQECTSTKVMRISINDHTETQYWEIKFLPELELGMKRNEIEFRRLYGFRGVSLTKFLGYNRIYTSNVTVETFCRDMIFDIKKQGNGIHVQSYSCNVETFTKTNVSILPILTYTCSSLSVLTLIVLIVHNRRRGLCLSIPGSNLENLSLSLLVSYVVFMASIGLSSIRRLCYIIGVILHYLWLSVFSFMTIAVVFIVLTIVQIKARNAVSDDETIKRRRAFRILGLLLPIIFVAPAVGVDQFGPSYLSSGYGKSVCFPNQYPANVIFFSGPVILSVVINSICLVHIIIKISRVRTEMKHIRKSAPFQDAKAYLRIAVLSGVFWITGILASVLQSEWLDYTFTILCGLQGFCIAVANLTTAQVKSKKKTSGEETEKSKMKNN